MIKSLSKKVAWLLVFMMVFNVIMIPNFAEATDAYIGKTESESYIKVVASGASDIEYMTITTYGGVNEHTNEEYDNVIRGNILIIFPENTDLSEVDVNLTAQKGFGFTLDNTTVSSGNSANFTLDLTQNNIATLDVSSDPDFIEGSYVIKGAIEDETITVITQINVNNPEKWLKEEYIVPPGYSAPTPSTYPYTADIQDAIDGFKDGVLIDTYIVDVGTTAMDVLEQFGMDHDMDITGIPYGYISYIGRDGYNQIGEFDINYYSGWMYTIDEGLGWYFPNVGASAKKLTCDTSMIWHFTMAYGADIGAPWAGPDGTPGGGGCGGTKPVSLPNNTGKLLWPVDSYEVTLWFGSIDEQYTVKNKGLNIQGEVNSNVFSVCDGIVSYTGYSPVYGNIIYVNYNYNGKPMQVRYGHLTDGASLNVGDRINKGDIIGRMAKDDERDKGVIEIVFCKSTDGKVCKNTGENVEFVEPIDYIEKKPAYSDYLSEPFATMLDTTGLAISEVTPNIIWPWEDESDPDVRYREDLDLESNEGYLKKLLIEYGTDIGKKYTEKTLKNENVLEYMDQYKVAIVHMNSRSEFYGHLYRNGVIKNNRMVVDKEELWYDLIGEKYDCEEGGTWTTSTVPNPLAFIYKQIYIPKEIADHLYVVTDGGQLEQELVNRAIELTPAGVEGFIKYVLQNMESRFLLRTLDILFLVFCFLMI